MGRSIGKAEEKGSVEEGGREQIELSAAAAASPPPGHKKSTDPDQNASKAACCSDRGGRESLFLSIRTGKYNVI